jgi:tetraacyldisaccharide-1-P 4'-kinase
MTEKDAVKWRGDRRDTWYVEVVAEVDGPLASALLDRIVRLMPLRGGGVADDG